MTVTLESEPPVTVAANVAPCPAAPVNQIFGTTVNPLPPLLIVTDVTVPITVSVGVAVCIVGGCCGASKFVAVNVQFALL
jgi:hypothetical protein